jgi:hypothetical protein
MITRTTSANIHSAVFALTKTMRSLGMINECEQPIVESGSSTMGNSWGVYLRDTTSGERRPYPGLDLHGAYSKNEAYMRIQSAFTMAFAIQYRKETR